MPTMSTIPDQNCFSKNMMFNEPEQVKLLRQFKMKPFTLALESFNFIAFNPERKLISNLTLPSPDFYNFIQKVQNGDLFPQKY